MRPKQIDENRDCPNARDRKSTTSELQSPDHLVCRLLLEKKKSTGTRFMPFWTATNRSSRPPRLRRMRSPACCRSRTPNSRSLNLFFNDAATTEIYTLSLHDTLPI